MTYPLFLEQLLLARDQFALEPTVRVNCTESGDFVEVDSISTSHRIIELNVGLKNLDFEERCERALEELAEAQDQIEEMAERIRGKDTEIAELESQVEELEEVNTEVYRDRDDGYSEITVQTYKLESDEDYEKRIQDQKEARAMEKQREKDIKSKTERLEKEQLRKLIQKYGTL